MAALRVTLCALLAAFAGCSGAQADHVAATARPSAPPVAARTSSSPLRVGDAAPPSVRLFAGTQSILGTAVRYCVQGSCVQGRSQPPRLAVDAGSVLAFAVGSPPERAVAELSGTGGGRRVLAPATLMPVPGRVGEGAHRITLALSWADASGTWAFDVLAR